MLRPALCLCAVLGCNTTAALAQYVECDAIDSIRGASKFKLLVNDMLQLDEQEQLSKRLLNDLKTALDDRIRTLRAKNDKNSHFHVVVCEKSRPSDPDFDLARIRSLYKSSVVSVVWGTAGTEKISLRQLVIPYHLELPNPAPFRNQLTYRNDKEFVFRLAQREAFTYALDGYFLLGVALKNISDGQSLPLALGYLCKAKSSFAEAKDAVSDELREFLEKKLQQLAATLKAPSRC
jgi:hypothetical protein